MSSTGQRLVTIVSMLSAQNVFYRPKVGNHSISALCTICLLYFFFVFLVFPFPALTDALAGLPYRTGRFARLFALRDHSKEGSIVAPFKENNETLIQINA